MVCAFFLTLGLAQAAKTMPLGDINGHPYYEEITDIHFRGIVEGYADGTYRPRNSINRAELTKIIIEAVYTGAEIQQFLSVASIFPFRDVSGDAWFSDYVYMAAGKGIVEGYDDRTFKPSNTVNFAESSKIMAKSFGLEMGPESEVWYVTYVEAMRKVGALPPSYKAPEQLVTRGEMAYMVAKILWHQEGYAMGAYHTEKSDLDLNDGKAKLLFFYATWCPKCQANQKKLISWYKEGEYAISTYRLDYDREIALKEQFSISAQDTFILLDETGEEVDRFQFPSEEKLKGALESGA